MRANENIEGLKINFVLTPGSVRQAARSRVRIDEYESGERDASAPKLHQSPYFMAPCSSRTGRARLELSL